MPKTREKYVVNGVDLFFVRNRNEQRVIKYLNELVEKNQLAITPEALKDAYAYALNNLPARYTQEGTIVLRDPVRRNSLEEVVESSIEHVLKNPKS
ncbi:late competence development ComFB family protein [Desulfovibrio sp. OttesenSCG-928-G15]|nr:late competence development ComFB family protein [Desulfovibrio sp. OttesenSCG-928-G15]